MNNLQRTASVIASVALLIGALAIGGGVPLAPARIADSTEEAAHNVEVAAGNTARAARLTEALRTVAQNVISQRNTSRHMLETQLALEESSKESARSSQAARRGIAAIGDALERLQRKLERLSRTSGAAAGDSADSAAAAERLSAAIELLEGRFQEAMRQSRKLNEKARGYREFRDGPG